MMALLESMTWYEIAIWAAIVVLVLLPPKWDPAIRLKEWLDDKERKRK